MRRWRSARNAAIASAPRPRNATCAAPPGSLLDAFAYHRAHVRSRSLPTTERPGTRRGGVPARRDRTAVHGARRQRHVEPRRRGDRVIAGPPCRHPSRVAAQPAGLLANRQLRRRRQGGAALLVVFRGHSRHRSVADDHRLGQLRPPARRRLSGDVETPYQRRHRRHAAPRDFTIFFVTPRGNNIGFHRLVDQDPDTLGDLDQRGASSGCFRVHASHATMIMDFLDVGDRVVVLTP